MKMKTNVEFRKALSFLLILAMLISPYGLSAWGNEVWAASEDEVANAVTDTLTSYYGTQMNHILYDWEEMLAVKASGGDLEDYILPPTDTGSGSSTVISALLKGDLTTAGNKASELVTSNELKSAGDAYSTALNIIAVEAYNRSVSDGEKITYNTAGAIEALLAYRTGNIFLDPYNNQPGADMVGMSLVALSLFSGDNGVVDAAITDAINQIKSMQASSGAYIGAWGAGVADSNTTAVIIWGLMAADPTNLAGYTSGEGLTPIDGLLTFLSPEGGYGYSDNASVNAYSTKQASLAMADIKSGFSSYATLSNSNIHYISAEAQVIDSAGKYTQAKLTLGNNKSLENALNKTLSTSDPVVLDDYNVYINGTLINSPTGLDVEEGDSVLAVAKKFTKVAYFKTADTDTMGVNKATVSFAGSVEMTLVEKTLESGDEAALPGVPVNYGTFLSSNNGYTDGSGKITITPVEAAMDYEITAARSGWDFFTSSMITYIDDSTAILPAIVTMTAGSHQTATVNIRIEGPDSNVLNDPDFTVVRTDGSRLTVYDAVTQALSHAGLPYVESSKFISSINGISYGSYGTNFKYDGWLYNIITPEYLNGTSFVSGMGTQFITGGEEIIVYYGNDDMTTVYPLVTSKLNNDGSITISVQHYATDWSTGSTNLVPTTDVTVSWGYLSGGEELTYTGVTNSSGEVLIPAEYASAGQHSLQINKGTEHLPDVIRLAPNHTIVVSADGTSIGGGGTQIEKKAYLSVRGPEGILKSETAYSWYQGMTALSILQSSGLNIELDSSGKYVKSVEGIGEFDLGANSGWLYSINGVTPPTTASSQYKLSEDDIVLWYFSKDYTKDSSSSSWTGVNTVTNIIEAKTDSSGTASATISEADFASLIDQGTHSLSFKSELANIVFDSLAMKTISKLSGDLKITVSKIASSELADTLPANINKRPTYQLSVTVGGKAVTNFNGKVTVSIPYNLADNENPSSIVIYSINADDKPEVVISSKYDEAAKRAVFTTDHFSMFAVGYSPVSFEDVTGHWSEPSIKYLAARGVINGKAQGKFMPDENISRAEFITILGNRIGVDFSKYSPSSFNDVAKTVWYAGAVGWAAENKIVTGYDGKFRPNDKISREEMAAILDRYMTGFERINSDSTAEAIPFEDDEMISDYAKSSVAKMQKLGIINGKTATTFAPFDKATRAETAKMIAVLIKMSVQ